MLMKRIVTTIALAMMSLCAMAQNNGFKRSIATLQAGEDSHYQIFSYDDNEGSRGYYLGLGAVSGTETFVLLGNNVNDAAQSLQAIMALFDAPKGDTMEYKAKLGAKLPEGDAVSCKVKVESKKQLCFTAKSHSTRIQKSSVKTLLKFLNSYQKRHPDK